MTERYRETSCGPLEVLCTGPFELRIAKDSGREREKRETEDEKGKEEEGKNKKEEGKKKRKEERNKKRKRKKERKSRKRKRIKERSTVKGRLMMLHRQPIAQLRRLDEFQELEDDSDKSEIEHGETFLHCGARDGRGYQTLREKKKSEVIVLQKDCELSEFFLRAVMTFQLTRLGVVIGVHLISKIVISTSVRI